MSNTIEAFHKSTNVLTGVKNLNNGFVSQAEQATDTLDRLKALTPPIRAELDASLVALGIDVVDFEALLVSLEVVTTAIDANLTLLETKV